MGRMLRAVGSWGQELRSGVAGRGPRFSPCCDFWQATQPLGALVFHLYPKDRNRIFLQEGGAGDWLAGWFGD